MRTCQSLSRSHAPRFFLFNMSSWFKSFFGACSCSVFELFPLFCFHCSCQDFLLVIHTCCPFIIPLSPLIGSCRHGLGALALDLPFSPDASDTSSRARTRSLRGAGEPGSTKDGDLRLRRPQVGHVGYRPGPRCRVLVVSYTPKPVRGERELRQASISKSVSDTSKSGGWRWLS